MAVKEFSVTWDTRSSAFLQEKKTLRAMARAMRKAGIDMTRAMRAEAKRLTRERIRIRAGYLANKTFPLVNTKEKRDIDKMEWRMPVGGREVPLAEFPNRQTKKGVSLEIQRGRRVLLKHAFRAKPKAKARKAVFLRPTTKNYPMGHRVGLRVSDSMRDKRTPTRVFIRAREVFSRGVKRLLPLELAKLK